jgi:hypothetical protein
MDEFAIHRVELKHDLSLIRDLDKEDIDRIRYAILRARKEGISIREAAPPKTSDQALHRGEMVLVNLTEADSKFDAERVRELEALVEELPVWP